MSKLVEQNKSKTMEPKLLFVYNAETGFFNKLTDFAHKIIFPATYPCSLCTLTYGRLEVAGEWAAYVRSLPLKSVFLYRDEWKYKDVCNTYPLVALEQEGGVQVLLTAGELDKLTSLEELRQRLDQLLERWAEV